MKAATDKKARGAKPATTAKGASSGGGKASPVVVAKVGRIVLFPTGRVRREAARERKLRAAEERTTGRAAAPVAHQEAAGRIVEGVFHGRGQIVAAGGTA